MPIEQHPLDGGISTGITYSTQYKSIRAAVWAGATLAELERWIGGGFDSRFMALIVQAYDSDELISLHREDAVIREMKRKAKQKHG